MIDLKKELRKHIIQVFVFILVIALFLNILERINDWLFVSGPDQLSGLFGLLGELAPVIFILIYVVGNVLLVPSHLFLLASGIIFGLWQGVVIALIAEVLSAAINYLIGKGAGKFFIHKFHGKRIHMIRKYIEKHGFGLVFVLRYLGFYFDIVSYAAGMAKVGFRKYILATFLGFLPYIFIYVYAGNVLAMEGTSGFITDILMFKGVLYGLFFLAYGVHQFYKRRKTLFE